MFKEVNLGKVWLPQELIDRVDMHREFMLESNEGSDCYDMLLNASFSDFFNDYLAKNCFKLLDD